MNDQRIAEATNEGDLMRAQSLEGAIEQTITEYLAAQLGVPSEILEGSDLGPGRSGSFDGRS